MANDSTFQALDYAVFALFLLFSLFVGIYHAWKQHKVEKKHKKNKTASQATMDFLMGGREMPVLPVALSLLTTFLSGVTMLGTPAEIYQRGVLFFIYYWMGGVAFAVSGLFFIPIFYRLQPTSVYEYFECRFGSMFLRRAAAVVFLVNTQFYMAIVLYSPAIALSGVSRVPTWPFILAIGALCTIYTTIGGLKAVVWTDTIQAFFMYLGVAVMIAKGVIDSGGITRVWEIAKETGRFDVANIWDPSPFLYNSIWASTFGAFALWMSLYGLNQMAVQRYCSLPTLNKSRLVIGLTIPFFMLLGTTACFIGLVMLAYFYNDCDPLDTKQYTKDQLVIAFAAQTLRSIPGFPGLFLACLFSSTLSTVSSGINSQAAVIWEDFVRHKWGHKFSELQAAFLNKMLVLFFGITATALAFLAEPAGGIIAAAFTLVGGIAGPLVGLFFLGVFVPRANRWGASVALVVAGTIVLIIAFGSIIAKPYVHYRLPANDTCYVGKNVSQAWMDGRHPSALYGDPDTFILFRFSRYNLPLFGIIAVMLIGTIVSYLWEDKDLDKMTAVERKKRAELTFIGYLRSESIVEPHNEFEMKRNTVNNGEMANPTFI